MEKRIIVFSGYNQRAVIAFLRVASQLNVKISIVALSQNDPILKTVYSKYVDHIRTTASLDFELFKGYIELLKKKHPNSTFLILPSAEGLNRFTLEYREQFCDLSVTVPLCRQSIYKQISNKKEFSELCEEYNFAIPKTSEAIPDLPFVAKPKKYLNSFGSSISPELIMTRADRSTFLMRKDINDFYFQEFVAGESFYILFYIPQNKLIKPSLFSQENLVQQPNGKSIIAARSSCIHYNPISQKYLTLLQTIGFFGFAMIELRKRNNIYYMIECNPRLWGPSQLFVDCNVPFFEEFLFDNNLIELLPENRYALPTESIYMWSGGIGKYTWEQLTYLGDYNKKQFLEEFRWFGNSDIYLREDTLEIYLQENGLHK